MTITPCANIHCPACSLFPEQLNGSGRALWTQAPRIPQNFIFRSQLLTGDQFLHCGPHLLIPTQILHRLVLSWLENTQCWYLYNRCIFVWVCQPIITLRIRWTCAWNQNSEADSDSKKIKWAAAAHFDFLSLTPCTSHIFVFVAVFCWRAHVSLSFWSKRWKVAKCVNDRCWSIPATFKSFP